MGDAKRFDLFAEFISQQVTNKQARIADVAAGKGYLSLALRQRGFKNVISFEPNIRNKVKGLQYKAQYFESGKDFDVIVGMHPDQATDVILDEAAKSRAMAIVAPCCALATRWTFWNMPQHVGRGIPIHRDTSTYMRWLKHLATESTKRGLHLNQATLPMNGRNVVLYGKRK